MFGRIRGIIRRIKKNYRSLNSNIPEVHRKESTVLVMVYSLYGGGAERVASILASGLAERYPVIVACCEKKEREYPLKKGVETVYCPMFYGSIKAKHRFYAKFIRRIKKQSNTAVAISFMFTMNRINILSKGREKIICCERNSPLKREPEHMPIIRKMYAQADYVVFQSILVRDLFDEKVRAHSTILPNPVSVSCRCSAHARHRIVNIGRLNPQKNQSMLIRVFARFAELYPEYTLSFYGDGELQPDLEKIARELGLQDKVLFHGNSEHVHEEVADAEMFVLSSNYEGLSNALLECMMMGMPCISTACEGSVDVIRDGENGLLTEVGNEEQLLRAMLRLAEDADLRERLGRAAAETAQRFRKEVVLQQWLSLVEGLMNGGKSLQENS